MRPSESFNVQFVMYSCNLSASAIASNCHLHPAISAQEATPVRRMRDHATDLRNTTIFARLRFRSHVTCESCSTVHYLSLSQRIATWLSQGFGNAFLRLFLIDRLLCSLDDAQYPLSISHAISQHDAWLKDFGIHHVSEFISPQTAD